MKRPQIIERIREALSVAKPGAKVILYGSEARGDAQPDSDIDLLVLVEGNRPFQTPFSVNIMNEGIAL